MSGILQIDANRTNGAKHHGPFTIDGKLRALPNSAHSVGPVTPAGKARISQNALRHGILAESVVLTSASREAFSNSLAEWRRVRLLCPKKELLAIEIDSQEEAQE